MKKEIKIDSVSIPIEINEEKVDKKVKEIQELINNKIKSLKAKYPSFDLEHILSIFILEILDEYWEVIKNKDSILEKMEILNEKIKEKIKKIDE